MAMRLLSFALRFVPICPAAAGDLAGRRYYVPKIFLRHDIMKNVLARFLDSKGVPRDAVENVTSTKHYYALHKTEFEHFERVVVWWSSIGLHSGEDMGNILRRFPNMLWMDLNLLESKTQWFLAELRFERHLIGALLSRNPNLLFHHAEVLGHFLQLLETIGLRRQQIQRLIQEDARVLEYCENVEELQSLVRWLTATLELRDEDCGSLLQRAPQLLDPARHEELPLLYEYLYRMGLQTKHIGKIFVQNPYALLHKLADIKSLFLTLRKHFHLRQKPLALMIAQYPKILSLDKETVKELAVFLKSAVGLGEDEVTALVLASPSVLLLDFSTALLPRFLFLREIMDIPLSEIRSFPGSLLHELEFCGQRFGFVEKYGAKRKALPLETVLGDSDIDFAKALGQSLAKYLQFLSWWRTPEHWKAALEEGHTRFAQRESV